MLPLHCFEAGRLPKLNLPPALFEPMRANECLVPVDPVTQREDQKTGDATTRRQAPDTNRPERDTSIYPLTLLIMNVPRSLRFF
jgi:hypothetical protein